MRKGTSLLSLAALLLVTSVCLLSYGSKAAMAAELEPTDSGAPSAIIIFPTGEKPNPVGAGMSPVAFNHVIHEKWMSKAGKDCMVCHHTGEPIACITCHTIEGTKNGNFVTLHQAMHTVKIQQTSENPPSSCVSCHAAQVKQRECAGCHTKLVSQNTRQSSAWCNVCHTITPNMTQAQYKAGINGTLPEDENEKLAEETAIARKQAQYWSPMSAPYKVSINTLSNKYQPCAFNHRHHVASLLERIQSNKLAGAFHTQPATLCVTCHHRTPASLTPPKCVNCHTPAIEVDQPGKPKLMAAFHLQCMNCHTDMKVGRPRNTDCETCHKIKPIQKSENKAEGL